MSFDLTKMYEDGLLEGDGAAVLASDKGYTSLRNLTTEMKGLERGGKPHGKQKPQVEQNNGAPRLTDEQTNVYQAVCALCDEVLDPRVAGDLGIDSRYFGHPLDSAQVVEAVASLSGERLARAQKIITDLQN